jgi:hypothetical protein
MISMLLAAATVSFYAEFLASSRPTPFGLFGPHVDSPDLQRRVVKLRCEEAEAAMDVVGEVLLVIGGDHPDFSK